MEREDFKDFGNVYKSKTLMMKKKMKMEIKLCGDQLNGLNLRKKNYFKYTIKTLDVDENFHIINMAKPVSRRATENTTTLENLINPLCNENPPNISVEKRKTYYLC